VLAGNEAAAAAGAGRALPLEGMAIGNGVVGSAVGDLLEMSNIKCRIKIMRDAHITDIGPLRSATWLRISTSSGSTATASSVRRPTAARSRPAAAALPARFRSG
jgi:hypothetical protein